MITAYDYESQEYARLRWQACLAETFDGKSVVRWHGKIEGQLKNLLDDAEKGRNFPYADKLREFLKIWRGNEITGSINREILDTLKAAADMLSVDTWNLASYFRSLRDQLRVLIASEEELPRDADMNQNDPYAGAGGGGGHGGGGGPPMSPDFGPDEKGGPGGPGGEGGGPGGPGGPGGGPEGPGGPGGGEPPMDVPPGEEGAPGAEPGSPEPGGEGGEQTNPEDMPDEDKDVGEL